MRDTDSYVPVPGKQSKSPQGMFCQPRTQGLCSPRGKSLGTRLMFCKEYIYTFPLKMWLFW
jgi:hypothetical protein